MVSKFVGLDPSYKGFGVSVIDSFNKKIIFNIENADCGDDSYFSFYSASKVLVDRISRKYFNFDGDLSVIGFEYPPTQGQMAPALYGLSFLLVSELENKIIKGLYGFNPTYLSFLLKTRKYLRSDVVNYASVLVELFLKEGYLIVDSNKERKDIPARGIKNDKLVAFLFALRLMILYESVPDNILSFIKGELKYIRLLDTKEHNIF